MTWERGGEREERLPLPPDRADPAVLRGKGERGALCVCTRVCARACVRARAVLVSYA